MDALIYGIQLHGRGTLIEAHELDLSVASEVTQARVTEALKVAPKLMKASWRWIIYPDFTR